MCCGYSLSCVWLFETPWSVAHQSPLSMGILPKRILEWVSMPSSRRLAQPRDQTQVSFIAGGFFTDWAMMEAQVYWSGCLSLLQGIFPTQESNQGLLHFRCILYQLSYQGSSLKVTAQINLKGLSLYIFIIYLWFQMLHLYIIHFEFIFVSGSNKRNDSISFFCVWFPVFPTQFWKDTINSYKQL